MLSNTSLLLVLLTMSIVALIDYIPRLINRAKPVLKAQTGYSRVPRYVILPTVYGNPSYLRFLEDNPFLKRYADKVIICTTKYESDEFMSELRKLCRRSGFRYRTVDTKNKHGTVMFSAYAIYKAAFRRYEQLGVKADTPCLIMDVDTYTDDNVNNLIRTFKSKNFDVASLRCHIDNPQTLVEKLQQYEYQLAMDNRRMDPWMTSGAASLGRAGVFRHVFSRHSDFFAGGDSEIGKLAKVMGYRVGFIDFLFLTEAPNTWREWYKQRLIWFSGGFRHHVVNMGSYGWQHFFVLFYNSLLVYMLLPLRWIEMLNFPFILPFLVVLSWIYTFILMAGRGWSKDLLILPIYSLIQSMFIVPMGFYRYLKLVKHHKSLGLLSFDMSAFSLGDRLVFKGLNVATVFVVLYAAIAFTMIRVGYWLQNSFWM